MGAGSFHGELGVVGPFDLGQLLILIGATGRLAFERDGARATLFFEGGRIVNAYDESGRDGEEAAHRVFAWRGGAFEFAPGPTGVTARIAESAESIMLEAARRIDETSGHAGEDGGAAARLLDRRSVMEKLRDAFDHVARSAAAPSGPDAPLLDALREPADRLFVRAGAPVRRLSAGRWSALADAPLAPSEYDELRGRLLDAAGAPARATTLPDGRTVGVAAIATEDGEALWLRLLRLAPPDLAAYRGPHEALRTLLALPQGTLLVGGASTAEADRLLHALLAAAAGRRPGAVVVVQETPVYRHAAHGTAVLAVAPAHAGEIVRALAPDVVAFEAGGPPQPDAWAALHGVPLVIGALTCDRADALAPRWIAAAGAAHARARMLLAAGPLGLIQSGPGEGGAASFTARLVRPGAGPAADHAQADAA